MVFRADRVLAVLRQKREAFATFDRGLSERREWYRQAMEKLCQWSSAKIAERVARLAFPGALPTQEWDLYSSWTVPLSKSGIAMKKAMNGQDQLLKTSLPLQ